MRVTQNMLMKQSYSGLQASMNRLASVQEQLTTGKVLNRPSDDPSGTTVAMRLRASLAAQKQYQRNGDDGIGWLNQADSTLATVTNQLNRAVDLAIQGSTGAASDQSYEALASEIDQIRASLISAGNNTYLGRPIFGGLTAGTVAYNDDGTLADPDALGTGIGVVRTIATGSTVRVDVEATDVFGDEGDSVFEHLAALSDALRSGDSSAISSAQDALQIDLSRITDVRSEVGARTNRIETAQSVAADQQLAMTNSLSEVEDTDLAEATVNLQMQEVAYQAALAATGRVIQPSLLDYLK